VSESVHFVAIPGFYTWEVPGKSISILLSLDLVDRLQQDVVRGFGAVPRRGAEVGGVLLGAVAGDGPMVRVEDYELVPIEYKRGPSYLLSEEDVHAFEAALEQSRQAGPNSLRPVGFFRSHTRDAAGLASEDLEMLSRYFPETETVVLLIRPFATKPSIGGFYFKEDGAFQSGAPLLEFSFRRKDLAPDEAPQQQAPRERPAPRSEPLPQRAERWPVQTPPVEIAEPVDTTSVEPAPKRKRGWIWFPLSCIFLLLGVLLGFQAALTVRPKVLGGSADPYSIALSVTASGNDLQLKWDRQSPAIRAAQKGILTIEDGTLLSKPTELSASELESGSVVVYPHSTNRVRFRLELIMKERDSLTETVEWRQ